ncbi:hypothetical protein GUJ93_ZPchr0002g26644 [Zizania palustris]|uniref:Uncharacterized protein n=1 Tax=Zizania palustris TaxID=103762 RepID=A0A8J5SD10_ZIZPA|nr:hypothetical protein GUJ93_ZPchr0002g26644 [Zizania palustris]
MGLLARGRAMEAVAERCQHHRSGLGKKRTEGRDSLQCPDQTVPANCVGSTPPTDRRKQQQPASVNIPLILLCFQPNPMAGLHAS